jgi:hypothetical protein
MSANRRSTEYPGGFPMGGALPRPVGYGGPPGGYQAINPPPPELPIPLGNYGQWEAPKPPPPPQGEGSTPDNYGRPSSREMVARSVRIGGDLTVVDPARTFKHQPFPVVAEITTPFYANPKTVLSGVRDIADGFIPRTVFVGTDEAGSDATIVAAAGFMTWEFRGLHPGGVWIRRFCTAPGQQVQLRTETFHDVAVKLINSTAAGINGTVIVTDALQDGTAPLDYTWLSVTYPGVGAYVRPFGATQGLPSATQAGFTWNSGGPGANGAIVTGVTAFTPFDALAPMFTLTGALTIIWRINLL